MEDVLHVPNPATRTFSTNLNQRLASSVQKFLLPYNEQLPWVPHAVEAAAQIIGRDAATAVISTSPPVAAHLAAARIKTRFGLTWLADFRDPILGNPGRPRRWARPYDALLEKYILAHADVVTAVTDASAQAMRNKYSWAREKIHVVWNGYDPQEPFGPLPIPDRPYRVLAHVGVLYGLRHPNGLTASISRLVEGSRLNPRQIRLRFVGPVEEMDAFIRNQETAALIAKGCIEIKAELVPRADAMREIATADFLLLIDIVNLSQVGYTVPAKLYDYIRTGRPILAVTDAGSPVERILERSGVPYACLYHRDADSVVDQKVMAFLRLPSDPASPSEWFHEQFDGRRQVRKIAGLLNSEPQEQASHQP